MHLTVSSSLVRNSDDGEIKFLTKGDNNNVDDRGLYAEVRPPSCPSCAVPPLIAQAACLLLARPLPHPLPRSPAPLLLASTLNPLFPSPCLSTCCHV